MKNVRAQWVATVDEIKEFIETEGEHVIGVTPNLIELDRTLMIPDAYSQADKAISMLASELALHGTYVEDQGVRCLAMSNDEIVNVLEEVRKHV